MPNVYPPRPQLPKAAPRPKALSAISWRPPCPLPPELRRTQSKPAQKQASPSKLVPLQIHGQAGTNKPSRTSSSASRLQSLLDAIMTPRSLKRAELVTTDLDESLKLHHIPILDHILFPFRP